MSDLFNKLGGGDRRSIGASDTVVAGILRDRTQFPQLIAGLSNTDRLVRMRCADASEKISRHHPDWLRPYQRTLIALAEHATEQELRWHLAQMLSRLDFSTHDRRRVEAILFTYLGDESRIVQAFALQALADLSKRSPPLRRRILPVLDDLRHTGSPAVRARARKILSALCRQS